MGVTLTPGTNGKFNFGGVDHATRTQDVDGDYDVIIPEDGVYSVSAEGPVAATSGTPTMGSVTIRILADGESLSVQLINWIVTNPPGTFFNIARVGVFLPMNAEITVQCYNDTDASVTFGNGTLLGHLDVTYETVRPLIPVDD